MSRILATIISVALVFSLCSCSETNAEENETSTQTEEVSTTTTAKESETTPTTTTKAPETTPEEASEEETTFYSVTAAETEPFVQTLTEADIELDGVPYKDLTSRQVLDLYIKYLQENELQKASFLWTDDNGMFTAEGVEILALDSISVECYYDCWPPENGFEPSDYNQAGYIWGYDIDYTYNGCEYDYLPLENFIEMKKENGYWKIYCAPTSPRMVSY